MNNRIKERFEEEGQGCVLKKKTRGGGDNPCTYERQNDACHYGLERQYGLLEGVEESGCETDPSSWKQGVENDCDHFFQQRGEENEIDVCCDFWEENDCLFFLSGCEIGLVFCVVDYAI